MEGWATFHPPLYYVLGAGVWSLLEPFGPRAVVTGLRVIGGLAGLCVGWVTWLLVLRTGGNATVAWVAAAIALFLPSAQIATAMIGNEALASGLVALSLLSLFHLQRDPKNIRVAALTGLLVGLAFITKYTAAFAVVACVVPFLRKDFDRATGRALTAALLVGGIVIAPVYLRNVALTGTPFPILREHEPTASQEAKNVLRPRRVADYLWLDPECLMRPSIYHIDGESTSELRRNFAMTNVWGLAYASTWYDAFAHRIPVPWHRDGVFSGPLLAVLGIVPTLITLLGFALAIAAAVRSRGRSDDAPFVVAAIVGLAMFVGFTSWAQSVVAIKASYLLPLVAPAGVFFARGIRFIGGDLRKIALALSATAALASAVVFTHALVFPAQPIEKMARIWRLLGSYLPDSHIAESVDRLTRGW